MSNISTTSQIQKNYQASKFTILPNQHTTWHNHHDIETFIVISGEGIIKVNNQDIPLIAGKIIELFPLENHIIFNTHSQNDLVICNLWWNNDRIFKETTKAKLSSANNRTASEEVNLILPSFTTPNGNLHLGHIAGPLLAGDIIKRIHKINNKKAYLLSGTLGHQTQIQVEADKLKKTYTETALHYSNNIKNSLDQINIATDCFVTLDKKDRLTAMVALLIKRLFDKGYIEERENEIFYCNDCKKYLFEANIYGNCPHCNHRVNAECENCYEYFHEKELKNPICLNCKNPPVLKKISRHFFRMDNFKHILENLYFQDSYTGIAKTFVEKILKKPLPVIPMTILATEGIFFASNDNQHHVLYSAIELLPRFLVAAEETVTNAFGNKNFEELLEAKNVNLILLFGVDNLYLRCIIFPILLCAFNEKLINKIYFIANDFYQLDKKKFSTSRNHVISVEKIKENFNLDYVRYFLTMTRPEFYSTTFNLDELTNFTKKGVLKRLEELVDLFHQKIEEKYHQSITNPGSFDNFHSSYQLFLDANIPLMLHYSNIKSINFTCYINLLSMLIDFTEKFFKAGINSRMNESHYRTFYALCAKGILSISILLWPICPNLAEKIQKKLLQDSNDAFFDIKHLNTWINQ